MILTCFISTYILFTCFYIFFTSQSDNLFYFSVRSHVSYMYTCIILSVIITGSSSLDSDPVSHDQLSDPVSHDQMSDPVSHDQMSDPVSHDQMSDPVSHDQMSPSSGESC